MEQHKDTIEIEAVSAVTGELVAAMGSLLRQLTTLEPATTETLAEVVRSPTTTLLVARDRADAGRIVGTLTLAVFRIPTSLRARIEDVVVDEAARGQGIGQALMREAIRLAELRGARSIDLTTHPSREAANRLYRRLGFQLRETNVYRYDIGDR